MSLLAITSRAPRRWIGLIALSAIAGAALALPQLASVPARILAACSGWIAVAVACELLSMLGFVFVFKLVFCPGMSWRRSVVGALRALGSGNVLPAGGLVGPAAGASSVAVERCSPNAMARSTIALTILTNGPGVLVLATLGGALSLGWLDGPHDLALTLLPAAVGLALAEATVVLASSAVADGERPRDGKHSAIDRLGEAVRAVRGGAGDARALLRARNWKLLGSLGYYAFDNALLWAAFQAYGQAPSVSVVVMGYLVGSLCCRSG
jgi:hypothetical protein